MNSWANPIKLVLVEPSGTLNLGSVARLCENFGIQELRLVEPRCNPVDTEAIKMAVRGAKLLETASQFSCLIDAIADCSRVIATCGRIDHGEIPLHQSEDALKWLLESCSSSPVALVFGREDRGLTNQELLLAQKVITLQTQPSYPSLNLSHAVAIVLHELQRCKQNVSKKGFEKAKKNDPASPTQINDCLIDAQNLLLEIGFLQKHTAESRMNKFKGLLQRAQVRPEEVSLIRGVLRQMRWAIKSCNS